LKEPEKTNRDWGTREKKPSYEKSISGKTGGKRVNKGTGRQPDKFVSPKRRVGPVPEKNALGKGGRNSKKPFQGARGGGEWVC